MSWLRDWSTTRSRKRAAAIPPFRQQGVPQGRGLKEELSSQHTAVQQEQHIRSCTIRHFWTFSQVMEKILFSSVKFKKKLYCLRSIQIYEHFFISATAAVAQPLALLSSDVLPPASSFSISTCTRNPKDTSINILEDVVWVAVFSLLFR